MSDMDLETDIIPAESGDLFGSSYSSWKGWESESFGGISARDRATYTRELREVRQPARSIDHSLPAHNRQKASSNSRRH